MNARLALAAVPLVGCAFLAVPCTPGEAAAQPSATTPQTATPTAGPPPIELQAAPGYGVVDLVWTVGEGACESFQVMRSPSGKEDWQPIGPETNGSEGAVGPQGRVLRYRDGSVRPGAEYVYRVGCRASGRWTYSSPVRVAMPKAVLRFHSIYPNPTDTVARIEFEIGEPGPATLEICNVLGVPVRKLLDGHAAAGLTSVTWDGKDAAGRKLDPGVYFARLTSAGQVLRRHIALIR